MTNCQLYKYGPDFYSRRVENPEYFAESFTQTEVDPDYVSWLNYHGLSQRAHIEALCSNLNIENLCVESIFTETRRAKVEEYPTYMFFSIKSAILDERNPEYIDSEQITFVLSHDYLISFQGKPSDYFTHIRKRIERNEGIIRKKSTDFLLFRMLESIIDNFFDLLEVINERINEIDESLHHAKSKSTLQEIEIEKRRLIALRKIVIPMRDVTLQLETADTPFMHENNRHYYANLRFLCESVLEEIDASKQILEGMDNLYYAAQGQRMNEVMQVLTVISSIFIPLTFIAGVYGMNFENMPELKHPGGYYATMSVMSLLAIVLLVTFWKKGWLKK